MWYSSLVSSDSIILFDGECNLCSSAVRYVLRWERTPWCRFASLQSEAGRRLIAEAGGDPASRATFYLLKEGKLLDRSSAALEVARHLRWPWRAFTLFRVVPAWFRDGLYDVVARNRFRWFGRHAVCAIPERAPINRFIA